MNENESLKKNIKYIYINFKGSKVCKFLFLKTENIFIANKSFAKTIFINKTIVVILKTFKFCGCNNINLLQQNTTIYGIWKPKFMGKDYLKSKCL